MWIINDDFNSATKELSAIVKAQRNEQAKQAIKYQITIKELLA
ncbi:MAG: guanylate kinase [Psychromonas sp.]